MEYSKEDLMEAKRQILGVGENMGTEESKKIWEENAQFWDNWEQMRENNYGLLLWGKVGTGKSYFAGCIANDKSKVDKEF